MSSPDAALARAPHRGIGFAEFVALMAALMAVNALAVDSMLPALPQIAADLGIEHENQQQWIITAYLLGLGACQILYGPLADRYGRKPTLLFGLAVYFVFSVVAVFASSFALMMVARVFQGVGSAAARVLVVAIVRDCYEGRRMARVMSLALIVFLAVPILAPSLGQAVMLAGSWHWIFLVLAGLSGVVFLWTWLRLPETLHPEDRLPLAYGRVGEAFRIVLTNRFAVGYMLAMTCVMGALFGFINSAQQVFVEALGAGIYFPLLFAGIALAIALASFTNSRIVERFGMRLVSHSAIIGFTLSAAINAGLALTGHLSLIAFALLQAVTMFCFGLTGPNFGAMAMEPVGHVAGTASSVQGFVTTLGGALLGFMIGQQFDGTAAPMLLGFAAFGAGAILIVLLTEGRLFKAHHAR
jgi:DHA1 family bicyclomycin/chloramphenicol resistance-like MFS transporter